MCGLVGVAGKIGANEEKVFHFLLQVDTMRGPHSTGVCFVRTNGDTEVVKKLGTPWDLYDHKQYQEADRLVANVLMGHNRWATKGKINSANAHPFEFDNLIGAHNGTLTSTYNLEDGHKFDVDSEALYHHMSRNGVEDAIRKANGAFALTWWDKEDQTINLIRNNERTLYWAHSVDQMTLFWASEDWMIKAACAKYNIGIGPVYFLNPLAHHKFFVNLGAVKDAKPFEKAVVRTLEGYKAPVYQSHGTVHRQQAPTPAKEAVLLSQQEHMRLCGKVAEFYVDSCVANVNQPYIQGYCSDNDGISIRLFPKKDSAQWKLLETSPNFFSVKIKGLTIVRSDYFLVGDLRTVTELEDKDDSSPFVINGIEVTEEQWRVSTKVGCSWCSEVPGAEDASELYWIDSAAHVCAACQQVEMVNEYIGLRN